MAATTHQPALCSTHQGALNHARQPPRTQMDDRLSRRPAAIRCCSTPPAPCQVACPALHLASLAKFAGPFTEALLSPPPSVK